jgi:nitroreductase
MDVFEYIMKRRSVRSFIPEPVGDDVVSEVLEAARWAPSAQNR